VTAPNPPLADEQYISLETFKKDGTGVKTPVWTAPLDGKLIVYSRDTAYKVKRLRRDPRARIAACDMRGNVRGPWLDATGRVLEDRDHIRRAHEALRAKYWLLKIGDVFARLVGKYDHRTYMEFTVTPAST
jgi:PPOX class probable F420-dependent enzyme